MAFSDRVRETIDEKVVQAQHLHERVLDELSSRAGREQGRALGFPRRADCGPASNSVRIAAFGIRIESGGHRKIKIAKLPRFDLAGSVGGCGRLREPPPPGGPAPRLELHER